MNSQPKLAPATNKSFFKRPTWATRAPANESGDFFRHSDTVYDSILKEKERRRQKQAQKKLSKSTNPDAGEKTQGNKRRRIGKLGDEEIQLVDRKIDQEEVGTSVSEEDEGESAGSAPCEYGIESPLTRDHLQETIASPGQPQQLLNSDDLTDNQAPKLESTGEDEKQKKSSSAQRGEEMAPIRVSDEDLSEEEDAYVLELKKKARERARLASLVVDSVHSPREISHTPEIQSQPNSVTTKAPRKDETIVQILITTSIPEAKPLLVNRRVSQPMQQVREVWCSRQGFDEEMTSKIIFTWRGRKLYDTTTSTGLLDVLKKERARQAGGLVADGDEESQSSEKIEVQAMTTEMYEQRLLQGGRDSAEDDPDQGMQDASAARSTTSQEPTYKIVLNGHGLEGLRLKVRPSTNISKLMAAFKKMRNIDAGKCCWLIHNGDRLEPDSTVAETEIEDEDVVEVHVR